MACPKKSSGFHVKGDYHEHKESSMSRNTAKKLKVEFPDYNHGRKPARDHSSTVST